MPEKSSLQKEERFWLTLRGPIMAGKAQWKHSVRRQRKGNAGAHTWRAHRGREGTEAGREMRVLHPVFLLFSL